MIKPSKNIHPLLESMRACCITFTHLALLIIESNLLRVSQLPRLSRRFWNGASVGFNFVKVGHPIKFGFPLKTFLVFLIVFSFPLLVSLDICQPSSVSTSLSRFGVGYIERPTVNALGFLALITATVFILVSVGTWGYIRNMQHESFYHTLRDHSALSCRAGDKGLQWSSVPRSLTRKAMGQSQEGHRSLKKQPCAHCANGDDHFHIK